MVLNMDTRKDFDLHQEASYGIDDIEPWIVLTRKTFIYNHTRHTLWKNGWRRTLDIVSRSTSLANWNETLITKWYWVVETRSSIKIKLRDKLNTNLKIKYHMITYDAHGNDTFYTKQELE